MLSSTRRLVWLSSLVVPVAALGFLLGGCPDPGGAFDDFVSRVPTADGGVTADAPKLDMLPNVQGTFLVGLVNTALTMPIRFLSTQTVTETSTSYKVNLSLQPLNKDTLAPVGTPAVFSNVDVNLETGEFTASLPGMLTIPAEANTLLPAPIVAEDVVIHGRLTSVDGYCGTLEGHVISPLELDLKQAMTTFGAVRTTSASPPFPAPATKCP